MSGTDLIIPEVLNVQAVFVEAGGVEKIIAEIETKARAVKTDISTTSGRMAVASLAHKVARSKTALDELGKNFVAELKKTTSAVDAERRTIRDRLDALKDEVRKPLTEWENADKLRFPSEVSEVISLGVKAGKLDATGDVSIRDYLAAAKAHEAEDRAGMAAMEARANAPTATYAVINAAADVFQSYGMHAKAEALFNKALAMQGADTTKQVVDVPRLLTRIGVAQLDQGKFADAQATFAKVTGPRQPLAQLLSIYTAQKAKGG